MVNSIPLTNELSGVEMNASILLAVGSEAARPRIGLEALAEKARVGIG